MSTGGQPTPAPAPAPSPNGAAVPWAGTPEGQTWQVDGKPWYETAVPEGPTREYVKSKNYAHPGALVNAAYEQERVISSRDDSKMIRIPDEGADPKDWDAVYGRLGRPASLDGYKDVKWGDNTDPRMVDFAKQISYKFGLSPARAEQMAGMWNEFAAKLGNQESHQTEQQAAEALAKLKTDWGQDFDTHRARGTQVLQALNKAGFADEDFKAVEQVAGIVPMVKLLATIGKLIGEGNFLDAQGGSPVDPANMTPEQAKSEITKLTADQAFQKTYLTKTEPGHNEAVQKMEKLYSVARVMIDRS